MRTAVQGYCTASSSDSLPTFLDNLSVPSSEVTLKMGPVGFPETLITNYHYLLRNNPEECRSDSVL